MPAGIWNQGTSGVNDLGYNHFFANAKVSTDRFIAVSILTSHQ
jgi:hypothetical protein